MGEIPWVSPRDRPGTAQHRRPAAVRRYGYALFRLDQDAGRGALRRVNKCPKPVAIFVAEEIARGLEEKGYSRRYIDCVQPRLQGLLALTGVAPDILAGSDKKDFGTAAVSGLLAGVDKECRRLK